MKIVLSSTTMERIGFDSLGAFPESYDGNRFVLVVGDYFNVVGWCNSSPWSGG